MFVTEAGIVRPVSLVQDEHAPGFMVKTVAGMSYAPAKPPGICKRAVWVLSYRSPFVLL